MMRTVLAYESQMRIVLVRATLVAMMQGCCGISLLSNFNTVQMQ